MDGGNGILIILSTVILTFTFQKRIMGGNLPIMVLEGKVAILTGAGGRGLGRGIAFSFICEGTQLIWDSCLEVRRSIGSGTSKGSYYRL